MTTAEDLRLEQTAFIAAVAGKLNDFLAERQNVMSAISRDIDPLMGSISNLVTGGKRLRGSRRDDVFGGNRSDASAVRPRERLNVHQA